MKHWDEGRVYACDTMSGLINKLLMLGGLASAAAVAVMCLVCLVVWLAGGKVATRK
jgi:hypothetical protein